MTYFLKSTEMSLLYSYVNQKKKDFLRDSAYGDAHRNILEVITSELHGEQQLMAEHFDSCTFL